MNSYLPSYIQYQNYKYIESDGKYYIIIQCFRLPKNIEFLDIINKIKSISISNISFFIKKLNSLQQTKQLTNSIVNCASEINSINKNQLDIEIIKQNKEDLENVRRKIQIDGESFYEVLINIMLSDYNLENLYKKVDYVESYLSANYIIFKRLNYRQDLGFKSCLPFSYNKFNSKLNLLTNGVLFLNPFYTTSILDENGIFLGTDFINNQIVFLNIFDKKYKNSNICILGSSGTGKSYLVKLYILRNILSKNKQIIFDLEGEYVDLYKSFNPIIIDFCDDKKINLLDIMFMSNKEDFFERKIKEVYNILNLDKKDFNLLYIELKKVYCKKGITNQKESLFNTFKGKIKYLNKVMKSFDEMPILNNLKNIKIPEELQILNGITSKIYRNIYDENTMIIFDFSKISTTKIESSIDIALNITNNILEYIDNYKLIYFDEFWKFIDYNKQKYTSIFSNFYKTIRKKKASIITITQDIEDLFSFDNNNYGKKILNNSNFKFIFSMNNLQNSIISKIVSDNIEDIAYLSKGRCLLNIDSLIVKLEINACEFERDVIERRDKH